MDRDAPVLGRPSTAAAETAVLRDRGGAGEAAFRADGGDSDWCALRAASVAGVRHRLSGQPGQDSFAWACLPDGLVVAIADGLGGVPGSDHTAGRAAAAAVAAVVEAAGRRRPTSAGPVELHLATGLEAANAAAAEGGATTLVLGLIGRSGEVSLARVGDSTAFHIGDGGSLVAGSVRTAGRGRRGHRDRRPARRDSSNPSSPPSPSRSEDLLLLATDGVADPWRDGPSTVAPVLAATLAGRPGPLELAQLASFSRQGCHDDRTMLVVWRHRGREP